MQRELELASHIRSFFPGAAARGRLAWSVAFQNGCSHFSRICLEGEVIVLTTGPLDLPGSPQSIAALNTLLPAASRIVCARDGLHLRTERVFHPDREIADVCRGAFHDFQAGLDIVAGAQTRCDESVQDAEEPDAPSPHWNAVADANGGWRVPLLPRAGVLHASPSLVRGDVLLPGEYAGEVRAAVAEVLLRCTSRLRYVKACAALASAAKWAAWIQSPPAAFGMEEALTSASLACAQCAAEASALQDIRLSRRFRDLASIWNLDGGPSQTKGEPQ